MTGILIDLNSATIAWLDQEQIRRARQGRSATYADILDELVAREERRTARLNRARKTDEQRLESQRQNGRKRWANLQPKEKSIAMQQLGRESWAAYPTAEMRSKEMRRRLPRPEPQPKLPKVKLIGKREHICPEHSRDYTKGKGLFGKLHGVFEQSEHVRGKRRQGERQ